MPEGSSPQPSGPPATRRGQYWCALVEATADRPRRLLLVDSAHHPDGARITLTGDPAQDGTGVGLVCTATFDGRSVVGLAVAPTTAAKAPPLWFAELRESAARPPAVHLMAFSGHGQPAGSLVAQPDLRALPVGSSDQLGAVRWYPGSGEVDQIYVQPAWRRRSIGRALLAAAETLSAARGWAPLWGDGQRTELGEAFRNARPWWHRGADLSHVAPPMTPGES